MAQADGVVSNASGAAVRADLNNQLAAAFTNHSGATEPATTYAYQWWADTTTGLLKIRNAANTDWVTVGTLATANLGLLSASGGTLTGALLADDGTESLPSIAFVGDTNTGIYSPGGDQFAVSTNGTQRLLIEADGDISLDGGGVFYDATNNRLGIGTTSPGATLDVNGTLRLSSTEDSQLEWVTGAQTWRGNVVSGGKWYLYDVTNAKFPLDVFANTTCKLDINTSHVALTTNDSERARIDSSGRLLVGTSTALTGTGGLVDQFQVGNGSISVGAYSANEFGNRIQFAKSRNATTGSQTVVQSGDTLGYLEWAGSDGTNLELAARITAQVDGTPGANDMPGRLVFSTTADGQSSPTARMVILSSGAITFDGTSSTSSTSTGAKAYINSAGVFYIAADGDQPLIVNRNTSDGTVVAIRQANTAEGSISVSGTTVSYNGAHLSRWSQLPGGAERTEILRGTVLSNIDEMCGWGEEDNEQLNRMKVSDVEGDPNVAGVFQAWDDDDDTYTNDFYCAMTGDFVIRIAQGVTVNRGDLLMSAGDGTAKPQDDDIIRSKTIAKVTSTHVTCTYEDGSYCVPCVLMAC